MSTEPHVPSEAEARFAYVDGLMDYGKPIAGQREELRAEFDRFIAKARADALREAARKLFSDKTAESGTTKAKHNAIYGLWLLDEADRIEEEA